MNQDKSITPFAINFRNEILEEAAQIADAMILEVMATDPLRAEPIERIGKKIRALKIVLPSGN